ncbi:MAG: ferrous iron transporter B [Oscillatoriaceae bacterium SKW80]|nr:ferrous iron transporter B [Oscillatoriaceae bacterium SKYG93]MCX8120362.1 ferrous iron transporter B [Oscillatoriaceae bacterium SKW80]MDW8453288.1 ferrous iron transporter B [Oscillatoriaceae cyanobacterium SKYGB_i_bin93]HIK27270.1 ferrous iron transporter B [Oscillatoriaceae cyanobacterium M7585_C2015_266]
MLSEIVYPEHIEIALAKIEALLADEKENSLSKNYPISKRSIALLLLQKDSEFWQKIKQDERLAREIEEVIATAESQVNEPLSTAIATARQQLAWAIEKKVLSEPTNQKNLLTERLHQLTVNPITGFPLLILILYYGVYKFVGEFGAGTLVDIIETFFEENINPNINHLVAQIFPWVPLQDLIANEYGIITLGIRYAVAIVLPVVATFFLMFSFLEDSGYLPRLSLMLDRLFKFLGLSGRAVIPMVLGLGCDTMATMVTRTLETKRERLIATFLLSLAVPCAAQWGVIIGLLAQNPLALLIWGGFITGIFIIVGYLIAKLIPGKQAGFYMEIPPLRIPKLQNILVKTWVRMKWYFLEILPLFIWASIFIWIGRLTGLFNVIIKGIEPLALGLGLPREAAPIFLYGFFRRDYGAAGLFDLQQKGIFSGNQLLITAIILTLFLPCIAQFQIMVKEQGLKSSLAIIAFILPFAFLMGYIMKVVLNVLGVNL